MAALIRLGDAADIPAAVSIFEQSSLAYHHGAWPNRAASVARLRANLLDAATWFLLAQAGPTLVGLAAAKPLRDQDGAGALIPGGWFLGYLYVVSERWGQGLGGALLDAVLAEARRRGGTRLHLWTGAANTRAQRLYRSRGFAPTSRAADGQGEWARVSDEFQR
jgi:GNAT superfamily N-acetyltransferase